MRKSRMLAGGRKSAGKPIFYHAVSRVVERRFAFGPDEKEKFERWAEKIGKDERVKTKVVRKGISKGETAQATSVDGNIRFGKMLRCRIRYFTDGAAIGSRDFVNEAFSTARE